MDHSKKWDMAKENKQVWNTRTSDRLAREILDKDDLILEIPRHAFRGILGEISKRVNSDLEFSSQACDALQLAGEDYTIKFI